MTPVDTNWPEERNAPREWPEQPHSLPHGFRAPGDQPDAVRPSDRIPVFLTAGQIDGLLAILEVRALMAPAARQLKAARDQHRTTHTEESTDA